MVEKIISIVNTSDQDGGPIWRLCISGGPDHHWVIKPPESETSRGTCTLCHTSRDFPNFMEISSDRQFKTRMSIREGSYIPLDRLRGEFSPEDESYD